MIPLQDLESRVHNVRGLLKKQKLSAMLVHTPANSLYLSGFPCSNSIILITQKQALFLTDFRYITKATATIRHMEVQLFPQQPLAETAALVKKLRLKTLGFEEQVPYSFYAALTKELNNSASLTPAGSILSAVRQVKSAAEIKQIHKNQRLNEQVLQSVLSGVTEGETEISIHTRIKQEMAEQNCEEAFGSIIAAGKNSALPHAIPSSAKVRRGQFLLFDMGAKQYHYHSDMTRTFGVGNKLPARAVEIYNVVLEAQLAALAAVKPGAECRSIDAIARGIIGRAGYGEYFGHGLGHGVGIEIHEGPTLNPRSTDVLKPGMVITIEPGIYLPELGGVRIEDLIVVTESGYKNLTSLSKNLQFIS